jgi:hypothetical protein
MGVKKAKDIKDVVKDRVGQVMKKTGNTQESLAAKMGYSGQTSISRRFMTDMGISVLVAMMDAMDYEVVLQPKEKAGCPSCRADSFRWRKRRVKKEELMRKVLVLVLCLSLVFGLIGCSGSPKTDTPATTQTEQTAQPEQTESKGINVEKELFDVKLNLPASMFEGDDMEEVKKNALAKGIHEVTVIADGSVTYIMSISKHKEMMDGIKKQLADSVTEFLADEENTATFKDVTFNGDYTEMTVKVDKAQYAPFYSQSAWLGVYGGHVSSIQRCEVRRSQSEHCK